MRLHFIQFLKLYHNPQRDHQALLLCRQHLQLLQTLAAGGALHTRHRFQQLSVLDFLVRELSLELEAQHPGRRSAAAGSAPRRSSSASSALELDSGRGGGGGGASGASSPASSLARQPALDAAVARSASAPVPTLRLPLREAQAPQQPRGLGGAAVPRLNLGGFGGLAGGAAHSPRDSGTPPPSSSRLGRPPLPPSARAALGSTPRMTSRLGRLPSVDRTPTPASMLGGGAPDNKGGRTSSSTFAVAADGRMNMQLAPLPPAESRTAVPRLGLGGLSKAGSDDCGMQQAHQQQQQQQQQQYHGGPAPPAIPALQLHGLGRGASTPQLQRPPSPAPPSDACSSSSSDAGDYEREGHGAATIPPVSGQPTPAQVAELPTNFAFSGDLEEDLDRLEAMELGEVRGGLSAVAGCNH